MKLAGSRFLSMAVAVVIAGGALAAQQAPAGARGGGQGGGQGAGGRQGRGGPPAEVKANQLGPNVYALQATGLSTVTVLAGPDGIFMVDSGTAALTERIVAAIKTVSDGPIRYLVNTHHHPDHTGGNENFGKMGVTLVSRDELRARLAATTGRGAAAPAALPLLTYKGSITMHMNGEEIRLIPVPAAHTDGDTMVYFPKADVLMTGDFYRSAGYPNIDRASGGTLNGMLQGLNAIIDLATPKTRIVPGHGAIVDEKAVAAHRDLAIALRDRVAALVKKGQTLEQITASKPTADYDASVPEVGTTGDRFIGQLYAELGGK
jgi:glyoxylase-like metal-dependent hydrolase (beta-lactamase superfamily II)